MKRGRFFVLFFYSLLTFFVATLLNDIVFDDSYDAFAHNLTTFQFTPFSFYDLHYLCLLILKQPLKLLQELLPKLSIFYTSYVFLNVGSLWYFLYTVDRHNKRKGSLFIYVVFLISAMLFLENIISITHTRFASVLTGLALINLLENKDGRHVNWMHYFVFLIGFLFRPESAMGSMFVVSLAFVLFRFNLSNYIRVIAFPILLVFLFFGSLSVHKNFTDRFEILIEPDIEYALSTGRIEPLSAMQTKEDSLRYEMAVNAMFIDTEFLHVDFLRKITKKQFRFDGVKFLSSMGNISFWYGYYPIFLVAFVACLLLLLLKRDFISAGKLLGYQLVIFLILSYLDYTVTVAERHFIGISLIVLALYLVYFNKYFKGVNLYWLVPVLIVGAFFSAKNALANQRQVFEDTSCLMANMEAFEKVFEEETVIINVNSFHLLDRNFSWINKPYSKNEYLLYDAVNYSVMPRNMAHLSTICSCDAYDASQFIDWLIQTDAVVMLTKERCELIEKYMLLVHDKKVRFELHELQKEMATPLCNENIFLEPFLPYKLEYD